jgi:hypothetical protein
VRAAEPIPWHPSVKALLAFPNLIARMDESPQWIEDLGGAFREQEPYVMDAVQNLRRRAQASGSLQSNDQYSVQQQGSSIAVYPAQPQVVYVPYYDPNVVYGTWWWPAYRPVFWRPWFARPTVFVSTTTLFVRSVDWQRRHVVHQFPHHPVPVWRGSSPAVQHANAPQHWRQQQQWREQQQRPAAPQNRPGSAPQNRPAVAQDEHSRQQWADQQARWREQQGRDQQRQEVRAPRTNPPAAAVPSTNMPQPVVRPISAPVQPISDTNRTQQQPRQTQPTIHNQPRAAHPFIESIRPRVEAGQPGQMQGRIQAQPARQFRPVVEAIRPHSEQRSQHRQANQPQQRRQAGQQPHRRG